MAVPPLPGASAQGVSFPDCLPVRGGADPYEQLLQRLRADRVPYTVLWELTHRCNLDCVMCYNVPQPAPELTTGECLGILEQLAAAGTLRLVLTGGEILTRPDFFTIAQRARELGFALDLKTNGMLMTPETADRIAALAPVQVDISLLGATETTFDRVARTRHSLPRVLRGTALLIERGVRVKLNTLLLALNVHEQRAMVDLATTLGVYYEQVFKISPADDGSNDASAHQLTTDRMLAALMADQTPLMLQHRAGGDRTCGVGLSSCLISPYGDVYPCIELRTSAGNLRRQSFSEMWRDALVFRQLREDHTWANLPDCRECPIADYCTGRCAGIAWKEHGDLYGGNTAACAQAQAHYLKVHPGEPVPETPLQRRYGRGAAGSDAARSPITLLSL